MASVAQRKPKINKDEDDRWLGLQEAAAYCDVSYNKMREIFGRDDFPVSKIGVCPKVKRSELDQYIKEGKAS